MKYFVSIKFNHVTNRWVVVHPTKQYKSFTDPKDAIDWCALEPNIMMTDPAIESRVEKRRQELASLKHHN